MKISSISDCHGNLIQYPSPYWEELWECEILFICGDILPLHIQFDMPKSQSWMLKEFKPWAESLPVEKVYFIAGNHDAWLERNEKLVRQLFPLSEKVTYVKNNLVEHISLQDGQTYRIFGSPYCHMFGNWPFMRTEEKLAELFSEIPENIDILFTHDAPHGVSDVCLEDRYGQFDHRGCPALRDAVLEKQPKLHLHGHLHTSNHEIELLGETKVVNCSILDEEYKITFNPFYIRL